MSTYDQVATRWRDRICGIDSRRNLMNPRMPVEDDRIFSYGSHFEIARIIRHRDGSPSHWLINGDRFSNTTTKHQGVVLSVIQRGMGQSYDSVTIPFSALEAASIDPSTVQIVQSTSDWWETKQEVRFEFPEGADWVYQHELLPGSQGWLHTKTQQWQDPGTDAGYYYSGRRPKDDAPPFVRPERKNDKTWDSYYDRVAEAEAEHEARYGHWEWQSGIQKNTGRKTVRNKRGWVEWEIVDHPDSPTGISYVREFQRHWLGASLIKAKVRYTAEVRCPECVGTGIAPHIEAVPGAEGPMTELQDAVWVRWHREDGVVTDPRHSIGSRIEERCENCSGRRRILARKVRTAYFLSAFDENEARPSYFFCELPPKVRPFTVTEAFDALKPQSVKLAEELGREVQRQGDIYWIPMPELTLRELKKQGGQHIRRKVEVVQTGTTWRGDPIRRMQWADGIDPSVLSTNHTASEQVRVGRLTYARGTLRHEPDGRAPDHARIRLGDGKTWGLVVKNTVPVGG